MMATLTNATVTITWQPNDRQPTVTPSDAEISPGGQVTWQVSVPTDDTAEVNFDVKEGIKGPFPVSGQPNNPTRGVYDGPTSNITTAAADGAPNTNWKYAVLIYDKDHNLLASVDPVIRIKEG